MIRALAITFVLAALLGFEHDSRTWAPVWRQANSVSVPRQGLAAIEVNGFIYAMGGAKGTTFLNSTEYARILEDGSLGAWHAGPPMNETRGYIDAVEQDGYIYVIGGGRGHSGKVLLRSVERARILADGSLSPWQTETHGMVRPRRCSKTVLVDGSIYAVGGFGGDMLNSVEHVRVKTGGGTEEWLEEQEQLTVMRYISGVKNVGAITYVVGGHAQETGGGIRDTEWSTVVDEAGFGKWQQTSPLLAARYGLGLAKHGDRLYALGGASATFLDSIEVASIQAGGGLGPWRMLATKLSSPRGMFAVVVYKDLIYVIGGGGTSTVEYATFNDAGEIGSWLDPDEFAAFESPPKQASVPVDLPFGGRIVKTMEAAPYIYLLIQTPDRGEEWLAAPFGEFRVGDEIRHGHGAIMTNFFSKQLGIRFPKVWFVDKVYKVE